MFHRFALAIVAVVLSSCSKPQTAVQLQDPAASKGAAVEVVSEDKLTSTPSKEASASQFLQIVQEGGSTYVVISAEPESERWSKGAPSLMSKGSPIIMERAVEESLLPKPLASFKGRSMRVFGASGEVCRGTLSAPSLLGRVEPHFGERQRWDGEEDENGNKSPALSDDRVAALAWDLTTDGKLLVAELVETTGDCQDALFARAADLPTLATTAWRRPSAGLAAQAMSAFRALPGYKEIDTSYRASQQKTSSESWTESQSADVTQVEFSTGKATYVWMSASAGEVCSDFSGRMNVLWKVSGTNAKTFAFEVVYQGEAEFSPDALVQIPGDDAPSLLGRESILRKDTKGYTVKDLHAPFLDCPC